MTNLLVNITVAIVTNFVVTTDEVKPPDHLWGNTVLLDATSAPAVYQVPVTPHPATVSNEVTEVVEVQRLEFEWDSQQHWGEHRKVLSRTERRWRKTETWNEEVQPK